MNEDLKDLTKGCIKCPKPQCKEACPLSNAIPDIVKLVQEGKTEEALDLLYTKNPFPLITGLFCNGYCFQNCVWTKANKPPYMYKNLENALGHLPYVNKVTDEKLKGKKVAIIGAGPIGISLALLLKRSSAEVTIFEKEKDNLVTIKVVFPETKVGKNELDAIDEFLSHQDLNIRYNCEVGKDVMLDDLRKEYDYVVLSAGYCHSKTTDIPGNSKYYYAYDFLKDLKQADYLDQFGNDFLLYGLGNVSLDLAVYLIHKGKNVKLVYHKPRERSRLSFYDIKKIDIYNLDVTFDTRVVDISNGGLTLEHEGSTYFMENRTVVLAIGQKSDYAFLNGSTITKEDFVYDENCESKVKDFYMAGDYSSTRWDISTGIETAFKIYHHLLEK